MLWWLLCFDDSALKCLCLGFFIISYFLVTFEYSKTRGMVEIVAAITNQVANTDFSIIVLILHKKELKLKKHLIMQLHTIKHVSQNQFTMWSKTMYECLVLLQVPKCFVPVQNFWASQKIWLHLVPLKKFLCRQKNQFYWMQIIF